LISYGGIKLDTKKKYQNWKLHKDKNKFLWLSLDRHNSSVNTLNQEVLAELDKILDACREDSTLKGVIICSAKKSGFIAGADISQFAEIKTADEAFHLIRQGQDVFAKLVALPKPTVAIIKGFCLGGGLELALACDYRVAENSTQTRLGLPEVLLGLHPGWGGTIRLPNLIGAKDAMRLILTGKIISAQEAAKLGIVDAVVPERVLEQAALHFVLDQPALHQPTFLQALTNSILFRPLLSRFFVRYLRKKINPAYYPAPFMVIENWQRDDEGSEAFLSEAKSIAELMVHPTGRNLVRVFFLRERLKALAKGLKFTPKHIHVVGAGTMGAGIAALCILSGFTVTIQDQSAEQIAPAIKKAYDLFAKKLRSPHATQAAMDRLFPDVEGLGIKKADVIIEAIYENLEAKQSLYRSIEPQLKKGALLATNTSSIPLADLNKALKNPTELIGLHFFNPVDKMQLVEVVADENTDPEMVSKGIAFVKQLNRLPLPVQSKPGFLVNRILMPYLLESMLLLEEGVQPNEIDKAAIDFGMPMGPIELADRVGLDVCLSVATNLTHYYGGSIPQCLRELVTQGRLGVKSAKGFYDYKKGKVIKSSFEENPSLLPPTEIANRLILRLLNEAVACFREGIVTDADLVDAGMIFGTGFAPFRGGPLHFAESVGITQIRNQLEELVTKYGKRFIPDDGWKLLEPRETVEINTIKPLEIQQQVNSQEM
jgi:3-hydroxyacyl-CoA dehydrogenase / enoyl-CoA hydratase / 3-hydroxybutyryl-CoA epimerase